MKLSFWTLGTPGWSNEAVVEDAVRFGFQGVDLRCNASGNVSLASSGEELDGLLRLYEANHLQIASLLAYNQRGTEEGVDWSSLTQDLIANARVAARLRTKGMRVNAGCPARDSSWDSYLRGLAHALREALDAVPEVELYVQNHPGSISAEQAGSLAELVRDPRFGIGFSPDHCLDMGEDVLAAAARTAPHVRQVYLADRERQPDGKLKACLPGTGLVPNAEVLEVLERQGFHGWMSFKWEKPTYPDLPDAEVALPRFVSFMSTLSQTSAS